MQQIEVTPAVQEKQGGLLAAYRETFPAIVRHPATWLLTLLWLAAAIYLLLLGVVSLWNFLLSCLSIAPLLLIIPLTQGAPVTTWEVPGSSSRSRL